MTTRNNVVTVACKIPNGLLLRIFRMAPAREQTPTGFRDIDRAEQVGETTKINGPSVPFGTVQEYTIIGGYALTPNVNKELFEAWLEQNAELPAVRAGLIFAHAKPAMVSDQAKEKKAAMSGLEPLNPDRIMRNGKSVPVDPRFPAQIEKANMKEDA
jgi:hypothetical protein